MPYQLKEVIERISKLENQSVLFVNLYLKTVILKFCPSFVDKIKQEVKSVLWFRKLLSYRTNNMGKPSDIHFKTKHRLLFDNKIKQKTIYVAEMSLKS